AMARSLWQGLARGRIEGGGSTITQQLVKRGGTPRSLLSKILEMREALALERRFSKTEILEAYLNCLPYGHGLIGPEAASRFHFRKPASELTFTEAIF
ncbi:MAG: transglycosylase domain-containing protein, partial [Terrimicrobiaceae bacterium]|nr:transglycosylase domain-containing protein [Terrimicrobiaceae bacterium]